MWQEELRLPQVASLALSEEGRGVAGGERRDDHDHRREDAAAIARPVNDEHDPGGERGTEGSDDERAAGEPAPPLRADENRPEALRSFEITGEERACDDEEAERDERRDADDGVSPGAAAQVDVAAERGEEAEPRGNAFGPDVGRDRPAPGSLTGDVVRDARLLDGKRARRFGQRGRRRHELAVVMRAAVGPHEGRVVSRGERIQRRVVRAYIEGVGTRALLGAANARGLRAVGTVCGEGASDFAGGVFEVAEEEGFLGADDDAGGEESFVDTVRAEVALRRRIAVRIHVDGIVRTGLHARLAADTRVVIEIDQAIGPLVHRGDRTDLDTGRFGAVITSKDGEVAFDFWKGADFDVLDPSAEGADGDVVLGFARGGTGMTAYTSGLVDDPGPAGHWVLAFGATCDDISWSWLGSGGWGD